MATSLLSIARFRYIFFISWIIIIADHIFLLRWFGWNWNIALADSLVNELLLLGICILLINILRFYMPQREKSYQLVIWGLIFTAMVIFSSNLILKSFYKDDPIYIDFLHDSLLLRGSLNFLLIGCFILIGVIWRNWQDTQEQEKIKADAEKMSKEAELFKLRQQLQPHFLFNSLNSINALIGLRPEEARKMVQQLSDFLRGTLKKEENQLVTLKEEMDYLKLYLDIEKVRFGNRLSTKIECEEGTLGMKLPSLLLQPVVENAIKFGLYDTTDEIEIGLTAKIMNSNLVIEVVNPFDPETSSPKQGTGFGLQSVHRRLQLLFARTGLLTTQVNGNIYITRVEIPQHV